ncbi:M10 family metallopeptidase C-terminal domain-containing protein [Bradyrhizobium genosp. P]|uniref:M10 family metallopeptidase C-terminal domain-containing protein n=1 Tax=Bradyrhizobium genosp. P TaxID=83641 RepID=UPI003CF7CA28
MAVLSQLSPALGDVIGNIKSAIGHGTIRRVNGIPVQVMAGDPVYPGDIIETAADGRIEIRFIDGTVFNLSSDTSVVLGEPARNCTGPLCSTPLAVTRGAFAFAAGELANTGSLTVETPFGSICSRTRAGGFATLSLAALTLSFVREALAADPNVTFLDDDTITYKELHHGVFELTTKEANPRHIIVEDPGETVVLSRRGSSISVNAIANTPAQMQALQMAQQAALANYAKGWGAIGSSTPPSLNPENLLQPINFFQPDPTLPLNQLPPLQTASFEFIELPRATLAITNIGGQINVAGDDIINAAKADAGVEITGATSGVENGQIVKVFIINGSNNVAYSGTATVNNGSWSIALSPAEAKTLADGIYTLKADVTNLFGFSAEASQVIRVDETPPTIAIAPVARNNVVNADTASTGFAIVGTTTDAENGQPVTVRILDSSGHVVDTFVTKLINDTWSINVTSAEAKLLHDGSYTAAADVSDSAGNPAPEATQVITVDETLPTLTWLPQAESGVEGSAIALGTITATANSLPGHSNGVQSLVVSSIPVGAVLTDGTNSFVATSGNTSVDVKGWTLSNLKITPPNDTNFTLTVTATDQDANTTSTSEQVTVAPLAPALHPVAAQGNENTAIALDLGATAQSLAGDVSPNNIAALLVSGIPVGAMLSDGTGLPGHSFTATAGDTAQEISHWNLSSLTITPSAEFEGNFTLTIAVNERDPEGDLSATVTAIAVVTVNPVAEPPTASAPPTLTLNENATGVAVGGVSVGPLAEDTDDTVSATLAVSHGTLHVAGLSGVTVSGNGGAMLTLSGSAALVDALLAGLTYTPTIEYEGSDTLRMSVTSSDGSNTYPALATAATAITVNPVAEPPTASAPPTLTLNENATGVAIAGVSVGPLAEDSDDTVSATLTVSHGALHVAGLSGVTVTGDDSATLTLSGSAAAVNALLAGLTYTPTTEYEGSDTLRLSVTSTDGSNTYPASANASTAITVNPVAEPPTASAPPILTLNENAVGAAIAGVSVGPSAEDADDTVSATLTVSHGTLHVAGSSSVTMTGDDSGTLTLTGTAAAVNALLAGLTYTPTTEYEGSDSLRLSVTSTDGSNTYPAPATVATAITVNPVAAPPTASAPPTLTLNENATGTAIAEVSVGPLAEEADDTVRATLTVSHGTLHVAGSSSVTMTGDDSGTLTLSGTAADVNALLAGLTYTPTTEYEGSDTLRLSVTSSDGSNTYPTPATVATAITVNPVAEPPTASAPPTLTLNENATGTAIAGVSVGPLAEDADDTVSATLTVSHGTLHVAGSSSVTMTGDDSGTLTLTGTAAAVNALLAGLTYTPTTEYEGSDTLRMSVTSRDGSNTYPTPATTATAITVNPVAEPPTASAPPTLTLTEDDIGVAIAGVSVGPPAEDADDTVSATLTVSHGTLHVAGSGSVTMTGDDSGTLTLTGTAAAVNALLAGLTYTPTDEYEGSDTFLLSVTSSDGANTYPTPATAATAISVTPNSESLIVGGPAPTLEWNDAANWSADVVPTLSINTIITASALYTVVIDGTSQAESLTMPHGSAMTDITASGTLQLAGNLDVSDSGKLENDGTLEETASASFIGPIINNGTIIVDPHVDLNVTGTITGAGKFWIDAGSTLEFATGSKVAPGLTDSQTVYFEQGTGKLIIDDWGKFAGVITGADIGTQLTSTDVIDLTQLPFIGGSMSVSVSYNSGTNISTMTFNDGSSANNVTLHLSGNYTGTTWTFTSINGGTGTEVSDPPAGVVPSAAVGHIAVSTGDGTASTLPVSPTFAGSQIRGAGGSGPSPMTAAGLWASTPGNTGAVNALDAGDTLANMIIVGLGATLPTGGTGGDTFVHSRILDSSAVQSDTITDLASGSDKIDLTAFGSFSRSILALTPTSTSVPAHTIAWLYDGKANQALVYANPTDHAVSIGDPSLVAIHLPGVANVHLSDFVLASTTAAPVAATSDSIDHAVTTQDDATVAATTTAADASDTTTVTASASDVSSDTKVSYDAPVADGDGTVQPISIPHSIDTIGNTIGMIDDAKLVGLAGAGTPSTENSLDGAAMAAPGGLSIEQTQIAMTALMQPGFTFDPKPVLDNANPTPIDHAAVTAPPSSDWIAPSWGDWNGNSEASPKNEGHDASPPKDAALTDTGGASAQGIDNSSNVVPAPESLKTPASIDGNGNSSSNGSGNHSVATDASADAVPDTGVLKAPASANGNGNGNSSSNGIGNHSIATHASADAVPDTGVLKTPASANGNGNSSSNGNHPIASDASENATPQQGAGAHDGGASPQGQHKSATTSDVEGPAVNDAAKPNDPVPNNQQEDTAVTPGSKVNQEGGEISGTLGDSFTFKDGISDLKGSSVTNLAELDSTPALSSDHKGNVASLASDGADAIGQPPHDQHPDHGASAHLPHDLIV